MKFVGTKITSYCTMYCIVQCIVFYNVYFVQCIVLYNLLYCTMCVLSIYTLLSHIQISLRVKETIIFNFKIYFIHLEAVNLLALAIVCV